MNKRTRVRGGTSREGESLLKIVCQTGDVVQDGPHTVSRVRPAERQKVGLYTTSCGDYSQCYSWGPSASNSVL